MPQINLGTIANDGTGDPLRTAFQKINQYGQFGDKIINAGFYKTTSITNEVAINLAIVAAAGLGAIAVLVPGSMFPYTASAISFNNAIQMLRESQNPGAYDVKAYGAVGNGLTDDSIAIQACVNACAASSGGGPGYVWLEASTYLIGTPIAVPNFVTISGSGIGSLMRAAGNNYIFDINPGNRTQINGLAFDALTVQASGGAIDFTNARQNVRLFDLWFVQNLFICLNIAPTTASQGGYVIDRVRWFGGANINTAFNIGDGAVFLSDVMISHAIGTSPLVNPVQDWVKIKVLTDTIFFTDCDFFQGVKGFTIGAGGGNSPTEVKLTNVSVDTMSTAGAGVNIGSCRDLHCFNLNINTCQRGLDLQANARDCRFVGGTIQNNAGSGVTCFTGATRFDFDGISVTDNNTANGGFGQSFDIGASISDFTITNCRIGNFELGTGHAKIGVNVAASCTRYSITDNNFQGNETAEVTDSSAVAYRRGNRMSTGQNQGLVTLAAANPAATVATVDVRTGDKIILSRHTAGGTLGHLSIGTITNATSFTIVASGNADTSTVDWEIVH